MKKKNLNELFSIKYDNFVEQGILQNIDNLSDSNYTSAISVKSKDSSIIASTKKQHQSLLIEQMAKNEAACNNPPLQ